ncbi:ABC transporter substrate-binding protein [Candidatus Bipolaricaulota bacterium]
MKKNQYMVLAGVLVLCLSMGLGSLSALAEPVTIQYYTLAWQPGVVKAIQRISREWNEANPDIQVDVVWGSWTSVNEFLLTSFLGGEAPDIFHTDAVMCYEYGALGFGAPLNGYLTEDARADVSQWMWDSASDYEGNIFGYPFLVETHVIFYNRTLFRNAGIEVPENSEISWDQLIDYSQRVTARDESGEVTTWGLMAPVSWEKFPWMLVAQNGGNIVSRQDDGTWVVDVDDAAREALSYYCDFVTRWDVMSTEAISNDYTTLVSAFSQEQHAMVVFGCWNRRILALWDTVDWGMLHLTGPVNNITSGGPQAHGIWAGSPHKEEAALFLDYISSGQNSIDIAYPDWVFPARTSLQSDPRFMAEENQWDLAQGWLDYAIDIWPTMPTIIAFDMRVVVPELEQVILGNKSLDDAIDAMEKNGNEYLQQVGLQ